MSSVYIVILLVHCITHVAGNRLQRTTSLGTMVTVTWAPFPFFFFQAEDGIRDYKVTGVQTCALPISSAPSSHHRQRSSSIQIRATDDDCDTGAKMVRTISRVLAGRARSASCQDDTWAGSNGTVRPTPGGIIAAVRVAVLLLACFALALVPNHLGAAPAAPGFSVKIFDSNATLDSRDLIGKSVLVVRFQASYCKPCG